jgi:hypothetical protein
VGAGSRGAAGGGGVTSTPMVGIERSKNRGIHQLAGPSSSMIEGTSTIRTRVTSSSTATAKPRPNTLRMCSGSLITNEPKTQNMIAAAAVMTRPVTARPSATDVEFSPVRSHSSRMRDSKKTS